MHADLLVERRIEGRVGLQAVCIPHISPIANVIMMAHAANLQTAPLEKRSYRPGDVGMASAFAALRMPTLRSSCYLLQCCPSIVSAVGLHCASLTNRSADIYGLVVVMHFAIFYGVCSHDHLLSACNTFRPLADVASGDTQVQLPQHAEEHRAP